MARFFPFLVLATILLPVAASQPQPSASIVRVHVLGQEQPRSVVLRAVDGPASVMLDRDGVVAATLQPGETAEVERLHDRLRLTMPALTIQAGVVELIPNPDAHLTVRTRSQRRAYPGRLVVEGAGDALRLVNHAPLPRYVASVVASEYPFPEPEGVKAQAVLARTYALRHLDPEAPFDLVDDTRAQVYRGLDATTPVSRAATQDTRGEVLTYRDELADATYYSSSGGHTAGNEEVWNGRPVPYLRPRPDPYDADAPDHRWTTTAASAEVLRALSRRFGGSVTGIDITRRTASGRVARVRLHGGRTPTISGAQFRSTINAALGIRTIRSTHFTVERDGSRYLFHGRGFGHGVGMSQYGARGLARSGRSYRDILAYYFEGTTLDVHDFVGVEPALVEYAGPVRRRPTPRREARTSAVDAIVEQLSAAPTWSGTAEKDQEEVPAPQPRRRSW
ncbi:MAG: SpoIID/LytB domain-containing protein [Rhodothermaceae bacterium]|nr:SpoIID/LytB domain-containing protein [Rhodothermaceae bacterium]